MERNVDKHCNSLTTFAAGDTRNTQLKICRLIWRYFKTFLIRTDNRR